MCREVEAFTEQLARAHLLLFQLGACPMTVVSVSKHTPDENLCENKKPQTA